MAQQARYAQYYSQQQGAQAYTQQQAAQQGYVQQAYAQQAYSPQAVTTAGEGGGGGVGGGGGGGGGGGDVWSTGAAQGQQPQMQAAPNGQEGQQYSAAYAMQPGPPQ